MIEKLRSPRECSGSTQHGIFTGARALSTMWRIPHRPRADASSVASAPTCVRLSLFIAPRIGDVPDMHDMAFLVDLSWCSAPRSLRSSGSGLAAASVGLILAGMTIGPHGFALVKSSDAVEPRGNRRRAAVVSIGPEFSLRRLWRTLVGDWRRRFASSRCTLVGALSAAVWRVLRVAMVAGFAGALEHRDHPQVARRSDDLTRAAIVTVASFKISRRR